MADERFRDRFSPRYNQEPLLVKNKVTPCKLGLKKSVECFSLQCFDAVGWATGRACDL